MFYLLTIWTVLTLIQKPTSHKQKISITNLKKKSKKAKSMLIVVFRRGHLQFTSGIICGSGSFAVEFGDHFRSGDHLRSEVICDAVQVEPKTDAFFDVLSSSSSQNITENQITSQKSSSSIDSRHFNFDLGGKKILIASLFYRLIRYKRFNGNQGIARIASIASVVFSPREALFKRQRRLFGNRA